MHSDTNTVPEGLLRAISLHNGGDEFKAWLIRNPNPTPKDIVEQLLQYYLRTTSWLPEWIQPVAKLDGRIEQAIRTAHPSVQQTMMIYPPYCVVVPLEILAIPAPRTVGFVASFSEYAPTIGVRQYPYNEQWGATLNQGQVIPIAYWIGITPDVVRHIIQSKRSSRLHV